VVNGPVKFRQLLAEHRLLVIPGVYNALLARVLEEMGFPCLYMSGFSVATSMLGKPDLGMLGLTEMAQQAKYIATAIDVPLLADADTGYGGIFSIKRTIEEYEMAGLAGLHIEDQDLLVKRCGWLGDVQLVETNVMLQRLKAALSARRNEEFFIIARTDGKRKLGFDEALRRAEVYAKEGADAVFVEYLTDIDEIKRVVDLVKVPVVVVVIDGEQMISASELEKAGVKVALFPISVLHATIGAAEKVGKALQDTGNTKTCLNQMANSESLLKYIRYQDMTKWESIVDS
jgi:2-methylisocitrate lyase-like PEP mutase family enzyme